MLIKISHYSDVTIAPQMTSLTIVYPPAYSEADQRKHQSSASLAFVRGIHRGPVNSPHKWPVTRKVFSFDDVIVQPYDITGSWRRLFVMNLHVYGDLNTKLKESRESKHLFIIVETHGH